MCGAPACRPRCGAADFRRLPMTEGGPAGRPFSTGGGGPHPAPRTHRGRIPRHSEVRADIRSRGPSRPPRRPKAVGSAGRELDERPEPPAGGPAPHGAGARARPARSLQHRSQPPGRLCHRARRAGRRGRLAPVRGRAARRDPRPRRGRRRRGGGDRLCDAGAVPPHRAHRAVHAGPDRSSGREGGGGHARSRSAGRGPGPSRSSRRPGSRSRADCSEPRRGP